MKRINLSIIFVGLVVPLLMFVNTVNAAYYGDDQPKYLSENPCFDGARAACEYLGPRISIWISPESEVGGNIYYTDQRVTVYFRVENATSAYYAVHSWFHGMWVYGETPALPLEINEDGIAEGNITYEACRLDFGADYLLTVGAENDEPPHGWPIKKEIFYEISYREFTLTDLERDIFEAVNARRGRALRFHEEASCAARNWTQRICEEGFPCGHEAPDGSWDTDPLRYGVRWSMAAIECSGSDGERIVERLMSSPTHETVLTDVSATHMGVGCGDCGPCEVIVVND